MDRVPLKYFIHATSHSQPAFLDNAMRLRADPDWTVFEVETGHDVMVNEPDLLSSILLEIGLAAERRGR